MKVVSIMPGKKKEKKGNCKNQSPIVPLSKVYSLITKLGIGNSTYHTNVLPVLKEPYYCKVVQ